MNRDTMDIKNISVAPHDHHTSSSSETIAAKGTWAIERKSNPRTSDAEKIMDLEEDKKVKQQQKPLIIRTEHLRPYDILCGRDKATFNYVGNRRFRISISLNIPRYDRATTKAKKASVIMFVCNLLKKEVGVRFLKKQKVDIFLEIN